jgi:hypothetical protein
MHCWRFHRSYCVSRGGVYAGLFPLIVSIGLAMFLARTIWMERRSETVALKSGVNVERILHDPEYFDPPKEFDVDGPGLPGYKKQQRNFYYIKHRTRKTSIWALPMPEKGSLCQYPNRWRLVEKQGGVSDALKELIETYSREPVWRKSRVWLEIQCHPERIGAFGDESDIRVASALYERLADLSEKSE